MRLNKMAAMRCGKCDSLWHKCIDHTYVHGGRQDQEWTYYRQPSRARSASQHSSASESQPRGKKPKGKKNRQKKNTNLAPELDPPWTTKTTPPLPALPDQPAASTSDAYVQELVAALREEECVLSTRVQKLVSEGPKTQTTSKDMHAAVKKLDQARSRFQAAQKARKTLHNSWSAYIEESIKRWKSFVADFSKKDQELEERVEKSKESLQQARENLDKVKESLSKQDAESLGVETISDAEGEEEITKMDSSETIQTGIATMVSSLETIQIRPQEEVMEEDNAGKAKRARVDSGGGSKAMQPFGVPGK